ncbi:MAG: lamin tail domain-containing protein [Nitriliruptorales bacterium]
MRRRLSQLPLCAAMLAGSCGSPGTPGTHTLPADEAAQYLTAYIAVVVADPPGDDLEPGGGEHVVVRNNWDHRADLGGWAIEDRDGNRLPIPFSVQIDPDAELRFFTGNGEDTDADFFAGLDHEVLDDDGDTLRLLDSSDKEVAAMTYP